MMSYWKKTKNLKVSNSPPRGEERLHRHSLPKKKIAESNVIISYSKKRKTI